MTGVGPEYAPGAGPDADATSVFSVAAPEPEPAAGTWAPATPNAPSPDFAGVERPAHAWVALPGSEFDATRRLPAVSAAPAPQPPPGGARPVGGRPSVGDRRLAALPHWVALFTFWVGPLAVLLTAGRTSRRVRDAAVASLNWEITVAMLLAASVFLARWGTIGPAVAIAVVILSVGLHLIGAITAWRGGSFTYPLALPIVR